MTDDPANSITPPEDDSAANVLDDDELGVAGADAEDGVAVPEDDASTSPEAPTEEPT